MPSLTLSDCSKKTKNQSLTETEPQPSFIGNKKTSILNPPYSDEDGLSGKKKKKKRKSETGSELLRSHDSKQENTKNNNKKKIKLEQPSLLMEEEEKEEEEEDPNAVSKFRISEALKAKLKEKGIESLFPIQATTFDTILYRFYYHSKNTEKGFFKLSLAFTF